MPWMTSSLHVGHSALAAASRSLCSCQTTGRSADLAAALSPSCGCQAKATCFCSHGCITSVLLTWRCLSKAACFWALGCITSSRLIWRVCVQGVHHESPTDLALPARTGAAPSQSEVNALRRYASRPSRLGTFITACGITARLAHKQSDFTCLDSVLVQRRRRPPLSAGHLPACS